jgi:hypothetical protein
LIVDWGIDRLTIDLPDWLIARIGAAVPAKTAGLATNPPIL